MYPGYLELGGVERSIDFSMTICIGPECDREARAQKNPPLCTAHFYHMQKWGQLRPLRKNKPAGLTCAFEGCERPEYATGYCRSHYEQNRLRGQVSKLGQNVGKRSPWCKEPGCGVETPATYCDKHRMDHYGACLCCDSPRSSASSPYCETHRQWDRYTRNAYGISAVQHKELLDAASNACQICGETTDLHIDHCHATGNVRGILCGNCNRAIGLLRDDPARIRRALDYLEGVKSLV